MDGIDAALVAIDPGGKGRGSLQLLAYRQQPWDDEMRRALVACARRGSSAAVARLDVAAGEAFAEAALALLRQAGVETTAVRCIGSHGQTIVHLPEPRRSGGRRVAATLQLGEPGVIAERTGITTVADFRRRDMAAGGQGAPLVPILDHRLYTDATRGRIALNLGGIANLTALPAGASIAQVRAFDTGPANVLLDAAARRAGLPGGIDDGGRRALRGRVDAELLAWLLEHPFYRRRPPKSADVSAFLGGYADGCWKRAQDLRIEDLSSTLAELTGRTVADAVGRWVAPHQDVDEVVVSGGGAHNRAVVRSLAQHLAPATVMPAGDAGAVSADSKEAVLFALLGCLALHGLPGNVPSATGAERAVVLGKIVPA